MSCRITAAQINPIVGDIEGNAEKIISIMQSQKSSTDIIVFPELCLTGYPPEDLLYRPGLYARVNSALDDIRNNSDGICVIVGHPMQTNGSCYNAASAIHNKKNIKTYFKQQLPNYGVFDEKRYFETGKDSSTFTFNEYNIAILICEDTWHKDTIYAAKEAGADVIISINASPYHQEKQPIREGKIAENLEGSGCPLIYVNCVGGQDELIFDGASFALDKNAKLCWRAPAFCEQITTLELNKNPADWNMQNIPKLNNYPNGIMAVYQALVLGTRDYVNKNGFIGTLIGLSGGIDSALTAAIAVDALGKDNVQCVLMPSQYTAEISNSDAAEEAESLGVKYDTISIEPIFHQFLSSLASQFKNTEEDTTEENLQARCRGTLLMALSNKFGKIVLTTGNKSEMSVGYSTLYGDMAGGFCVLKDITKTLVYALATFRNKLPTYIENILSPTPPEITEKNNSKIIPQRVIDRPASAELRAEQTDQDTLPEYEILDQILQRYIEKDESIATITAAGFDHDTIIKVTRMVNRNEYKRRQAPPGIKISPRAFGKDRRYPITSRYWRENAVF